MQVLHLRPSEREELEAYLRQRNLPGERGATDADRRVVG